MRNSSNSFLPIFLKLYRCFCRGLMMCMWFGYTPQIIFYYVFCILNLVIFQAQILSKGIDSGYLVCELLLQFNVDPFETLQVFLSWSKMCMWFGYNPQNTSCHFNRILNVVIFQSWILLKCIDGGYLVCATPPAVLCPSLPNFTGVFVMVWRCACGLDIILRLRFVTFSSFWT